MIRSLGVVCLCALVGATALAACSGVQTLDRSTIESMTLAEVAETPPAMEELLAPGGEPLIIEVPAGEVVPLVLSVEMPFLAVEAGENQVRFERDVFLYIGPGEMMISFDGERWARLGDWDAFKEIAGAEQGSLSIGFGVTEEHGPQMNVALELK